MDIQIMDSQRIDELEQLARAYIDGEITRGEVNNLNCFDRWYVLTLANIYSCTKIGTMSPKECVHYKYKVAGDYKQFIIEFGYILKLHDIWLENIRRYSYKNTELSKELAKDSPDAYALLSGLFEMNDLLTRENVLLSLFDRKWNEDGDFKKKCQSAVREHGDEWREKYKSIKDEDYIILLDKFFSAMDGNGMALVMGSLGDDYIKKSSLSVPVKDDDTRGVAKSFRELYGKERKM